ncbi:hypothetical protein HU200_000799 [Digitaria exilis]|uniref:RING-type domain-containing protein n=1 Tax=Digitaria exilis TaxID=1010633 RepID=A0A835KWP4_9POAL|nr:hypothetical protein HU200_000799 [Digitaria exilis]
MVLGPIFALLSTQMGSLGSRAHAPPQPLGLALAVHRQDAMDLNNPPPTLPEEAVACSICLDPIEPAGARSVAWLQCGHTFHLGQSGALLSLPLPLPLPTNPHPISTSCDWILAVCAGFDLTGETNSGGCVHGIAG